MIIVVDLRDCHLRDLFWIVICCDYCCCVVIHCLLCCCHLLHYHSTLLFVPFDYDALFILTLRCWLIAVSLCYCCLPFVTFCSVVVGERCLLLRFVYFVVDVVVTLWTLLHLFNSVWCLLPRLFPVVRSTTLPFPLLRCLFPLLIARYLTVVFPPVAFTLFVALPFYCSTVYCSFGDYRLITIVTATFVVVWIWRSVV